MHPAHIYYYYSQLGGEALPDIILLSEDFTGTVIDTNKGTVTNPNSTNLSITQNNNLIFTRVTDVNITTQADYWQSVDSFSKMAVVAFAMQRTSGYTNSVTRAGFFVDDNNRIQVTNTSGTLRWAGVVGGVVQWNIDTTLGTDTLRIIKIIYRANGDAELYHFTGGAWVQLDQTRNIDIGSSFPVRISSASSSTDVAGHTFVYDGVRVTNYDYATQLP